jgi:hypothetical protein
MLLNTSCYILYDTKTRKQTPTPEEFSSFITRYFYMLKVIPDVIRSFGLPNPSRRNMALGSTQSLTEMSTRNLPGGKGRPNGA